MSYSSIARSFHQILQKPFFNDSRVISKIYIAVAILISLKIYFLETWDNYDCFSASFGHLIRNLDLYLAYPLEYHTLYNYSPSFAVLMGVYDYFPDSIGILLWNLTHTLVFVITIHLLPIDEQKKNFLLWFSLIEFITAAENVQTNASAVALIMLVFIFQQKGNTTLSSLFFAIGIFFKIYILTAGVFFICFPKKIPFALKVIFWSVILFCLPLIFISPEQLYFLYGSWIERLQKQSDRHSLSILGVIDLLHFEGLKHSYVILAGLLTTLFVLVKKEAYQDKNFQLVYLGAILMFTIIFNPGVESPTYIIAIPGVVLWYLYTQKEKWHIYLLISVFILTCLSPTELFPPVIKEKVFNPFHVKAIPVIITWFICIFNLFNWKTSPSKENS